MIRLIKYEKKSRLIVLVSSIVLLNSCADSHYNDPDHNDKTYTTFDAYKENKLMIENRARYQKEKELLDEDKLYKSREEKARRSHFNNEVDR